MKIHMIGLLILHIPPNKFQTPLERRQKATFKMGKHFTEESLLGKIAKRKRDVSIALRL
jgi:hypothetical protein